MVKKEKIEVEKNSVKKIQTAKKQNLKVEEKTIETKVELKTENDEKKGGADEKKVEIKKPPFLYLTTQKRIKELEIELGCPVLVYFKPSNSNIWTEDMYAILECFKIIGKQKKLALYIRSDGGSGMTSLRIINLLRSYVGELILLAPSECASAATMLALGCDEIQMGPVSSLSPVDSSLTHSLSPVDKFNNKVPVSLDELWRVLRLWHEADGTNGDSGDQENSTNLEKMEIQDNLDHQNNQQNVKNNIQALNNSAKSASSNENPYKYLYNYIHPMVFGAVDRYSSLSVRICKEILSYHITDTLKIDKINKSLNYDYPAHGYPIMLKEAQKLGLPATRIGDRALEILNHLQLLYNETSNPQITDFSQTNYHNNSILSIIEADGLQIVYESNYDKHYLPEEKRYITLNDESCWIKTERKSKKGKVNRKKIYF